MKLSVKSVTYSLPIAFLLLFLSGCSSDDGGMLCETGPVDFNFEVVEKTTGEHVFETGRYSYEELSIENSQEEAVDFNFEPSRKVFQVLLGWETKADTYLVALGEEFKFEIDFSLERSVGENGCSGTRVEKLEIKGAEAETNNTTGITTIFVEVQAENE